MSRNLKMLGLCLVATLAMSAVASSSASAWFKSNADHTLFSGSQVGTNTFSITAGTIHCGVGTFSGTTTSTESNEVEVTPTYQNCTATPFGGATVHTNSCTYQITTDGQVHLICPGNNKIVVTAPFCTITIYPQTLQGVSFHNVGSGSTTEIQVTAGLFDIHYTQTAGCTHGSGTFSNGHYSGAIQMTGENTAKEHLAISHHIT